jgi:hypothetical protein
MNWAKALKGGLLGGLNMTVFVLVLRTLGLTPLNLEMMLGSLVTKRAEVFPWFAGLAIHLALSSMTGLLYGVLMERAGKRGTWVGMTIGTVHAAVFGMLLPAMARLHPLINGGQLPDPGLFAANMGALTVLIFVAAHMVYGIVVGDIYQLKPHPETKAEPLRIAARRPVTARNKQIP